MITIDQAKIIEYGQTLSHKTLKNADGTPMRCRVNGKVQTCKTKPDQFKLPIKTGLYTFGYIDNFEWNNADEWSIAE